MTEKIQCSRCKLFKDKTEFYTNKTKRGFDYHCKLCGTERRSVIYDSEKQKARNIKRRYSKYGITEQDYQRLRVTQNFSCAICKRLEIDCSKNSLHIDHCHETGKVRGLLCMNCNAALGLVNDNKSILMELIKYLERS